MGLADDFIARSKDKLREVREWWSDVKENVRLDAFFQQAQADVQEAKVYLDTNEVSPDEALSIVHSLVESNPMYYLVQENYGIMPINGPGLSKQMVEVLHAVNERLEPESEQAIELAELVVDNFTLSELLRKVPTHRSQELHDSLLEKCPEPIRTDLEDDYPKYTEEQMSVGNYTMFLG